MVAPSRTRGRCWMLKPSLETHNVDGILVAEFWDCFRLDPAPVQDLRAAYEAHLKNRGRPDVVVDLSGVGFAGSAALGNFVAIHRQTKQHGGRLVLCNVDPTVREVLRASKLDALFEFAGDRAAALLKINEAPPPAVADKDANSQAAPPLEKPTLGARPAMAPLRRRRAIRNPREHDCYFLRGAEDVRHDEDSGHRARRYQDRSFPGSSAFRRANGSRNR